MAILLSPWVTLSIAGASLVASKTFRRRFLGIDGPRPLFANPSSLPETSSIPELPPGLPIVGQSPEGEQIPLLEKEPLWHVVDGLVEYAKKIRPSVVFGIHPAGRILSAYIVDQLKLEPADCIYISSGRTEAENIKIDFDPRQLSGTALVVDDITRRGNTFLAVRKFIKECNDSGELKLDQVKFGVLVRCAKQSEPRTVIRPDWVGYRSDSKECNFPWTERTWKMKMALLARERGLHDDSRLKMYNDIRTDMRAALAAFWEDIGPRLAINSIY